MRHFSLRPRCPQYAHVLRNESGSTATNPASSNCGRVHHWEIRTVSVGYGQRPTIAPRRGNSRSRACLSRRPTRSDCSLVCIDNASHDGEAQSCPAGSTWIGLPEAIEGARCVLGVMPGPESFTSSTTLSRVRRRGPSLERRSTCGESHC